MPLKSDRSPRSSGNEHPPAPYRVQVETEGLGWETVHRTHCPVCLAVSSGFSESGRPKYGGGILIVSTPALPRGFAVFCSCWLGRRRALVQAGKSGSKRVDQLEPGAFTLTYPLLSKRQRVVNEREEVVTEAPEREPSHLILVLPPPPAKTEVQEFEF